MLSDILNAPFIIAILIALSVHECAHAFVAYRLGDPTAKEEGRLTLNPIAHLDPLGALMFLLVRFGWGKPVPVDPRNFRHPKRDAALVALAGPVSNLLVAIVVLLMLDRTVSQAALAGNDLLTTYGGRSQAFLLAVLANTLSLNLGLMAFNLLPIAPLDGSKVVQLFVPPRHELAYETFMDRGPLILVALLVLENILHVPLISLWISAVISVTSRFLSFL